MGLRGLWNRLRGLVEREDEAFDELGARKKRENRARRARLGVGPSVSSREAARLLGERSELLPEMKRDFYRQIWDGAVTVVRSDGTIWKP